MSTSTRWLLPAGIEEVLPKEAAVLESYRRKLLDLFSSWGYQLVIPPFIEFVDSLLIGECDDLDLQTFKLTDQLSGRMMGVRADMTPQVARIDAHMIKSDAPSRLCYCGTVLHTRPESAGGSRSPLQIGAELYGHKGLSSDIEIISLMMSTLRNSGIEHTVLDLGHTGIYQALIKKAALDKTVESELFAMLQRKSLPDIQQLLASVECSSDIKNAIINLVNLHGSTDVLSQAREQISIGGDDISACIDYLEELSEQLTGNIGETSIHYDLAEASGYHYQQGIVFSAFHANDGSELARGGRYDNIGESFGRARPAIGFSADLRKLIDSSAYNESTSLIYAPADNDPALKQAINELRANGEIVIKAITGDLNEAKSMACSRVLKNKNNKWVIQDL